MVLRVVASRSSSDGRRGRGGPPLGLLGLGVLIALVAAYLSDCIPGLGAGGSLGVPQAETKSPAEADADAKKAEATEAESKKTEDAGISIEVKGEQCRQGAGALAPCPEICAALDRTNAASTHVEVDASSGRHGIVEDLRGCLQEAGFVDVRVRSE